MCHNNRDVGAEFRLGGRRAQSLNGVSFCILQNCTPLLHSGELLNMRAVRGVFDVIWQLELVELRAELLTYLP
jgi:hypothetical protein